MVRTNVDTTAGRLRGAATPGGVAFKGIPFATAARFAPPGPIEPWEGTRDALACGPQAPQSPSILDHMFGEARLAQSEDCLSLNVWTPAVDDRARPVLVWIHGGAFTNGTGAAPWYDGAAFVREGCVLVTCNYRLGALGFLAHPGLGRTAGNLGLLDQLAVLRWVHDEIRAFGGDPGNVTAFGESAGGCSVLALLASPLAEGLFHKAWAMSPSLSQLRSLDRARQVAADVAGAAGLAPDDGEGLRSLPVDALLDAQAAALSQHDPFTAFAPTPDGEVLADSDVPSASAAGWGAAVPLVLGATRDEMALFTAFDPAVQRLDRDGLLARLAGSFGDRANDALAAYVRAYPGATPATLASAIATDHAFRMPATRVAEVRSAAGAPTWLYSFTYATPAFGGLLGSCHALDVPFAFHTLDAPGVTMFTGDGPERTAVASAYHGAIAALARDDTVGWPQYDLAARPVYRFDAECELVKDPQPELHALYR
jgi:para-nitrobenzyl esterase